MFEDAQGDDIVLDLLKTGEHRLAYSRRRWRRTLRAPEPPGRGAVPPSISVSASVGPKDQMRFGTSNSRDQVRPRVGVPTRTMSGWESRPPSPRRSARWRPRRCVRPAPHRAAARAWWREFRRARWGYIRAHGRGNQGERRRLLTDEHGDRMFEQGALNLGIDLLRLAGQQLRLCAHDVRSGGHSETVAARRSSETAARPPRCHPAASAIGPARAIRNSPSPAQPGPTGAPRRAPPRSTARGAIALHRRPDLSPDIQFPAA